MQNIINNFKYYVYKAKLKDTDNKEEGFLAIKYANNQRITST